MRFGPNGIPLSCKGRTWLDAIQDVRNLDLEAIEFQLLRTPPEEEIEAMMDGSIPAVENGEAIKARAKSLDIFVGAHTPYYMDLLGNEEAVERSMRYLRWSGQVAHEIGARLIVTHIGYYNDLSREVAIERAVTVIRKVRDNYKKKGYDLFIGLEVNGKKDLFGDLDEIMAVCKRINGTIPVVNFAHLHARGRGLFKRSEDFEEVLAQLFQLDAPFVYTLFSGLEHDFEGNELRFTPIKKGDMRFNPLAEALIEHRDKEIIIISSSPLLEHDAQYMKVIIARIDEKREQKAEAARLAEEARLKAEAEKAEAELERTAEERKKAAARKKAEAEERKKAAAKKKAEAERKRAAAKRKAEAERKRAAAKRKAEAERKRTAAKKKAEAERKRAAAKKKAEAERKKAAAKKKADAIAKRKADARKGSDAKRPPGQKGTK